MNFEFSNKVIELQNKLTNFLSTLAANATEP